MSAERDGAVESANAAVLLDTVEQWVQYALDRLALDPRDTDWMRNRLLEYVQERDDRPEIAALRSSEQGTDINPDLLDNHVISNDEIMGLLSAPPSQVQDAFAAIAQDDGGMEAMAWLYRYGVANGYIKQARLAQNVRFEGHGLVVTINKAKPEFTDARAAARANSVDGSFARCTICHENEGLASRDKRTLRTVPVKLGGESWFWQFSPYGYFHEHGICVNHQHVPMHVDRMTFVRLLDFVDQFPGYFLGCNAALPRIGGSVLAHDHYQGGGEVLPMQVAPAVHVLTVPESPIAAEPGESGTFESSESSMVSNRGTSEPATRCDPDSDASHASGYKAYGQCNDEVPQVIVETLDWPASALRVVSRSRKAVVAVCERIRKAWASYANPELGIVPFGPNGEAQSSISPSARVTERGYEMSIILRNNAVSDEYPLGVFHAHPEYFFVKKEAIGLIEAQGLFILPARLERQLTRLAAALNAGEPLPDEVAAFALAANEVRERMGRSKPANAKDTSHDTDNAGDADPCTVHTLLRDEIALVCRHILHNIAVFPDEAQLCTFLEELGFCKQ